MHRSVVAGVWTIAVGAVVCCAGAVPAGAVSSGGAPWCAGSTKTAAISAIKTAWDYVFDGAKRYSLDQRAHYIHRLDRNQRFLADYQASAKKHVIAAAITTVKINHVTCRTMTKADVDYDLVISGIVARGVARRGLAVLDREAWKVSARTYCEYRALGDSTVGRSPWCGPILKKAGEAPPPPTSLARRRGG